MQAKTVLITGASGNLGKAVINTFLKSAYNVAAAVQPGHIIEKKQFCHPFEVDLLDENKTNSFVQMVADKFNTIDAAVLTVGGFAMGNLFDTGKTELDTMYKLNFETAFFCARAVFKKMFDQENGGRIVLIASRPSLDPATGKDMLAYTLSKSLVVNLAKILNAEGENENVVTSLIVPGIIDTPENRQAMPDADISLWVSPKAIANVIDFACSAPAEDLRNPIFKVYGNG
jgi:NAD(P)-dependent dehydrogenase (short-subunit alcohol dehydrogenase family)